MMGEARQSLSSSGNGAPGQPRRTTQERARRSFEAETRCINAYHLNNRAATRGPSRRTQGSRQESGSMDNQCAVKYVGDGGNHGSLQQDYVDHNAGKHGDAGHTRARRSK